MAARQPSTKRMDAMLSPRRNSSQVGTPHSSATPRSGVSRANSMVRARPPPHLARSDSSFKRSFAGRLPDTPRLTNPRARFGGIDQERGPGDETTAQFKVIQKGAVPPLAQRSCGSL